MAKAYVAWSIAFYLASLAHTKRVKEFKNQRIETAAVKAQAQEQALDDDFEAGGLDLAPSLMEEEQSEDLIGGIGDYSKFRGASRNARMFVFPFERLAFASPKDRKKEWSTYADYNGNGHMSLAELDAYIEKKLKQTFASKPGVDPLLLWKAFRPSYIRAFMDAKDVGEDKAIRGISATTDDYIQLREFRVALHYVCLYALMYDRFAEVDWYGYGGEVGEFLGGKPPKLKSDEYDDRRIDLDEWRKGYRKLSNSGFVGLQGISDPDAVFAEMDTDGGGKILLKEWCEYLEKKEAEASTAFGELLTIGE